MKAMAMQSDVNQQNMRRQPPETEEIQHEDNLLQQVCGWRKPRINLSIVPSSTPHASQSKHKITRKGYACTYDRERGFLTQNKAPTLQLNSVIAQSHFRSGKDRLSLEAQVQKIRECETLPSETLSAVRKQEIVSLACKAFPFVVVTRQEHLRSLRKAFKKLHGESHTSLMNKAAWSSISTTNSDTGYRFTMGFRNVGCAYWRENPFHVGCFCCGYCSGIVPEVEPTQDELEMQFEDGLEQALKTHVDFDVVEFLNDGSFFNDEEFSPSFRRYLFRRVNSLPFVKRLLVETRPEYIKKESILQVLSEFSHAKSLEVAIGLESADEFIRGVCIRKGFSRDDFERATQCLSSFDGRISILAYSLVKPAFLSEVEAIKDQIQTARYLVRLSSRYKCKITMKLEPAVVAKGTLLDFLYFHGQENINHAYRVMSYWTIIEILCRLRQENIILPVRVGSRNDMDVIEKVPAVYDKNGMFSKWDFVLYEAVQRFNVHGSVERLLLEIEDALSDKSFHDWKQRLGLQVTAIEACCQKYAFEIEQLKGRTDNRSKKAFFSQVFSALNRIEYEVKGMWFAKILAHRQGRYTAEEIKAEVQEFIEGEFQEVTKDVQIKVVDVYFEVDGTRLMRICLQIRDKKKKDALYDVWIGIPTVSHTAGQSDDQESEQRLTELSLAI